VAKKALKKLKAEDITPKGAPHPRYAVVHNGKIEATTGLRHSSSRDIPVPHVKRDLKVSLSFVLDLARCPKSRDDYLRAIGAIEVEEEGNESEPAQS